MLPASIRMSFTVESVWENFRSYIPFGYSTTANEDPQLTEDFGDSPTPSGALQAVRLKLTKEKAKSARLEKEYQRAKVEITTVTETGRKLEAEIREVREKVGRVGRDVGSRS